MPSPLRPTVGRANHTFYGETLLLAVVLKAALVLDGKLIGEGADVGEAKSHF